MRIAARRACRRRPSFGQLREPEIVAASCASSNSGVYRTLSLAKTARAATQRGVFHDNVFLDLELARPHLLLGAASEPFDVIVLTHLDDGVRSLAIDEMTDHRAAREAAFAKLELEAVALEADAARADADATLDTRTSRERLASPTTRLRPPSGARAPRRCSTRGGSASA